MKFPCQNFLLHVPGQNYRDRWLSLLSPLPHFHLVPASRNPDLVSFVNRCDKKRNLIDFVTELL